MKTYKLNNGVLIPAFGLGTFLMTENKTYDIVLEALKLGYRHIDTAAYYFNEKEVGKAIKDSNIPREEIFLTTKIMKHHGGDKSLIRESINKALNELGLEYIDLLLIHWPNHDYKINKAVWEVFEEFYEAKKLRAIGVSNFLIHHLNELLKTAKIKPAINQVECHPLLPQIPLHQYLKDHNILMSSYGPFARGEVFKEPVFNELSLIANKYKITVAQLIIAWGLKRNLTMIPKTVHHERLKENLLGSQIEISLEDVLKINKLNKAKKLYSDPDNANYFL